MMNKIATNKTKIKQRIEQLEEQSQVLRKELEEELEVTKDKVTDLGKIILGIAGGLVFSAILLGGFFGKKRKKIGNKGEYKSKRVYHRFRDQLTHELTSQATEFLLGLAKDKLNTYIEKRENTDDDSEITG